jgi:Glycosyl hydrolase family 12
MSTDRRLFAPLAAASGSPGSYPSLYKGCHWGLCSTGSGLPNGAEAMIWLNRNGGVQPFGSQIAGNVVIGGVTCTAG